MKLLLGNILLLWFLIPFVFAETDVEVEPTFETFTTTTTTTPTPANITVVFASVTQLYEHGPDSEEDGTADAVAGVPNIDVFGENEDALTTRRIRNSDSSPLAILIPRDAEKASLLGLPGLTGIPKQITLTVIQVNNLLASLGLTRTLFLMDTNTILEVADCLANCYGNKKCIEAAQLCNSASLNFIECLDEAGKLANSYGTDGSNTYSSSDVAVLLQYSPYYSSGSSSSYGNYGKAGSSSYGNYGGAGSSYSKGSYGGYQQQYQLPSLPNLPQQFMQSVNPYYQNYQGYSQNYYSQNSYPQSYSGQSYGQSYGQSNYGQGSYGQSNYGQGSYGQSTPASYDKSASTNDQSTTYSGSSSINPNNDGSTTQYDGTKQVRRAVIPYQPMQQYYTRRSRSPRQFRRY